MKTRQVYDIKLTHANRSIGSWRGSFLDMPRLEQLIEVLTEERDELAERDFDDDEVAEDHANDRINEIDILIELVNYLSPLPPAFCSATYEDVAVVSRIKIGCIDISRREVYAP